MTALGGIVFDPVVNTANRMGGVDVSAGEGTGQFNSQSFWQGIMGWDFISVWEMRTHSDSGLFLPVLQGMPQP